MVSVSAGTMRVGIVGPSWWVNYWHLPALQRHPSAEICGVAGATMRGADEVAGKYGPNARFFDNYERLFDEVALDGVIVCTPNDLHYPVTMAALGRGLHVHVEKPVALNAGQAYEMAETARRAGLVGMTNFPYRSNPAMVEMRARVAGGDIGAVLHVSGSYHGGFGLRHAPNWRALRERSGAGILGDLGSHLIDLVRFATGREFRAVCGHTITALWEEQQLTRIVPSDSPDAGARNDDSCAFLAEIDGGVQGIFHTSWVAHQGAHHQHQELEVYGTDGRLHFLATHAGTRLRRLGPTQPEWSDIEVPGTHPPGRDGAATEEDWFRPGRHDESSTTWRWIDAIMRSDTSITPSLVDGLAAQRVIDAVVRSSAERRWVAVG